MTNIIIFPERVKEKADTSFTKPPQKNVRLKGIKALLRGILRFFQCFILLGWPVIRWFVYLDLLLAFLKMVFHSNPHATVVFGLHCIVFLSGAVFVAFYGSDRENKSDIKLSCKRTISQ